MDYLGHRTLCTVVLSSEKLDIAKNSLRRSDGYGFAIADVTYHRRENVPSRPIHRIQIPVSCYAAYAASVNETIEDRLSYMRNIFDYMPIITGFGLSEMPWGMPDSRHRLYTAIIRPDKRDNVRSALQQFGRKEITITDVRWQEDNSLSEKLQIDVAVPKDFGDAVHGAIRRAARTGEAGDGNIWWRPAEYVTVGTGELFPYDRLTSKYMLHTAIVSSGKLKPVKDALNEIENSGITITEVRESRVQIEVVVNKHLSNQVHQAITEAASIGGPSGELVMREPVFNVKQYD